MFNQPTQIPRSPLASTLTLAFHAGLALVVVGLIAVPSIPRVHQTGPLVYIPAVALPDLRFEIPPPPPPAPVVPVPRLETPRPEPAVVLPPAVIERTVVATPVPPSLPASSPLPRPSPARTPEPSTVEPPREAAVVPVRPPVTVGAFADAATTVRSDRTAHVAPSGFETAAAAAALRTRRDVQAVDGFGSTAAPGVTARATVADAGFGTTLSTPATARAAMSPAAAGFASEPAGRAVSAAPRAAAAAGFGSEPARPQPAAIPTSAATPAGFTVDAPSPARPAAAASTPQPDRQVEIVFKPTPGYTPEARARRIEGEVTLDVEFTARGAVRVLRVVRGLGHGLDEMAQRAAEQIRFTPATHRGTPVDVRATLTILFRLT